MQNSGLSNAMNPLISIAHQKVYSIPLILIIGWRGSPKIKDEPQHNVKGKITEKILKLLNIKYTIIRSNKDLKNFDKQIKKSSILFTVSLFGPMLIPKKPLGEFFEILFDIISDP